MTPRRTMEQRGLVVRAPSPSSHLLVVWESYLTPSQPRYTKIPPQTGGNSYFLIEKSPKTPFKKKPLTRLNSEVFLMNRSRIKNFYFRPFCVTYNNSFRIHICPQASELGLTLSTLSCSLCHMPGWEVPWGKGHTVGPKLQGRPHQGVKCIFQVCT
jgi:hypothetical protein